MRSWRRRAVVAGAVAALLGLVLLLPLVTLGGAPPAVASAEAAGLHPVLLDAYLSASAASSEVASGCEVRWTVLAGIGQVESASLAGRAIAPDGSVEPPVVGVALDGGGGTAAIADTDGGALDGDVVWDRAVGPLQLLPSSWRAYGQDGDGDGTADPQNVYDAALAAAAHLCRTAPGDYDDIAALSAALYAYNRSSAYVERVLGWIAHFDALGSVEASALAPGGYALPLERRWFEANPSWLTKPHHDYPAADLPVPVGTPVYAAAAGTVRATSAPTSRCGLGVVVAGADGHEWVYCHAEALLVFTDMAVAAGQVLMRSGNTGHSTGPHLHFGVQRPDGTRLCPQPLLTAWFTGVAASPASAPSSGCSY